MIDVNAGPRVFKALGYACAVGIAYRAFGASIIDVTCQLAGRSDIVVLRSQNILTQLVTLAGLLIGALGANKFINYKACQLPSELMRRETEPKNKEKKEPKHAS